MHGGCDFWEPDERLAFFDAALAAEAALNAARAGAAPPAPPLAFAHETHRMRALGSPWAARGALAARPALRVTADLSHWVIASERAMGDFPADAAWWPEVRSFARVRGRSA